MFVTLSLSSCAKNRFWYHLVCSGQNANLYLVMTVMFVVVHDDMVTKMAELTSDIVTHKNKPTGLRQELKELRHDILSHFFDGLRDCSFFMG